MRNDTEYVQGYPADREPADEADALGSPDTADSPGTAADSLPADEDRPVVDSFVDDTRGADPYAIPEPALAPPPAFTAEPVQPADPAYPADAQTGQVTEAAPVGPADSTEAAPVGPADSHDPVEDSGDAAYAGGVDADLIDTESAAVAGPAAEMMPGDVDASMTPMAVVIPAAEADRLRDRWQQLQLRFIDNPRDTAGEAQTLVGEVVQALTTALNSQRDTLDDWQGSAGEDTEIFRAAVMRYRDFFERLLSL